MQLNTHEKSLLIDILNNEIKRLNIKEGDYMQEILKVDHTQKDIIKDILHSIYKRKQHCFSILRKLESEVSIND